jgi:hypothetical protein
MAEVEALGMWSARFRGEGPLNATQHDIIVELQQETAGCISEYLTKLW